MKSLSPATRRIIAVALLIAVVALPYQLVLKPVFAQYDAYQAEVTNEQDMLARFRRLADSRDELRARLAALQDKPTSTTGYLTGESETLVAAELQTLVRNTVERNGGRLESTQVLPATSESGYRKVALRVRMSADTEALFRILYDLESALPYLFLDSLDIVSRDRRARRRGQGDAGSSTLSVACDVFGYMRSG
jgi:general secretion pathway protein M